MAVTKVWIEDGCIACGACEDTCPEVFEMPDLAQVKEGVDLSKYSEKIKKAAEECPVEVIKYDEN